MPKDFTAELVGCKLCEQPLDIYNVACGKPQEVDTTPPHPTRFEALFGLYRDYKEYDYEDWQIAKPSSCSEDVSEEVEAALLYYAQKSLERRQNSIGTTLWERMKRTATNLAQRIVEWAPLSATLSSQIAETAEPNGS